MNVSGIRHFYNSNYKGTDLNRNYDISWMASGTSSNKCSDIYGGASAFSELESQAHRDHQTPLLFKRAYLTYHAYSEVIIYPYSTTYAAEAWNKAELNEVAGKMTDNIQVLFTLYQKIVKLNYITFYKSYFVKNVPISHFVSNLNFLANKTLPTQSHFFITGEKFTNTSF